jgi:hypothetical protein
MSAARHESVQHSMQAEDGESCSTEPGWNCAVALEGGDSSCELILFGSVAGGAFSEASDVDLLIVISDETAPEDRRLLRNAVRDLEIMHGLRLPESRTRNPLEMFAEHAGGHGHSCFFCTRCDLNSGEVARIFGLHAT